MDNNLPNAVIFECFVFWVIGGNYENYEGDFV